MYGLTEHNTFFIADEFFLFISAQVAPDSHLFCSNLQTTEGANNVSVIALRIALIYESPNRDENDFRRENLKIHVLSPTPMPNLFGSGQWALSIFVQLISHNFSLLSDSLLLCSQHGEGYLAFYYNGLVLVYVSLSLNIIPDFFRFVMTAAQIKRCQRSAFSFWCCSSSTLFT